MEEKIKAEAGLASPPTARRHRAPLLWLLIPGLGGLVVAGPWVGRLRESLTDVGVCAALAAVFLGGLRATWAPRAWGFALILAMAAAGMLARKSGNLPLTLLPPRRGAALTSLTVAIQKINPPKPQPHSPLVACSAVGRITVAPRIAPALLGQSIYFSLLLHPGDPPPLRSAEIELSGRLKTVPPTGGPDTFNGYLRGQGVPIEMSPAWLRAERAPPSPAAEACDHLAERMNTLLGVGFEQHRDLAAIFRAMMLGRKTDLSTAQKNLFIASGTMHLFAINGLHIGIVALSLHALLGLLRCPRPLGSALVLAVLWLDVESTGASPSAVRAFLMAAMVETAHACWLPINPLASLAAAAAAMVALDPQDLFSASFQMSFGVVAALILLGVPLSDWLKRRWPTYPLLPPSSLRWWQRWRVGAQHHLLGALGFGAAAAAFSAITGVEYFGAFSPSGIVANLTLMPLAMLVIVSGFVSILCGLAHFAAASALFNAAGRVLLQAIVAALQAIVSVPGASFSAHYRADCLGPIALTAFLSACFWGYAHDWRKETGGWWPPFAITVWVLLFGATYR